MTFTRADIFTVDARLGYIIPIAFLGHLVSSGMPVDILTSGILFASLACMFAIRTAGYRCFSFVTIVAVAHLVFYPGPAFFNLLLESPAVRDDLWVSAGLAMWGCAVGCFGLGIGAILSRSALPKVRFRLVDSAPSVKYNLILFAAVPAIAAAMLYSGLYFHGDMTGGRYAIENRIFSNLFNIVSHVGYIGMFLQLRLYMASRLKADLILFLSMFFFALLIFLPSGSRTKAMQFIPLLVLYYLHIETRNTTRVIIFVVGLALVLFTTTAMGLYREMAGREVTSLRESVSSMESAVDVGRDDKTRSTRLIVGRLSQFATTGRVMEFTPEVIPYRFFNGVDTWWQMFVPGFLRPDIELGMEGPRLALRYGVGTEESHAPIMIVGDLYSRGGWTGVFLGMCLIGSLLAILDRNFLDRGDVLSVFLFVLIGKGVLNLTGASCLDVFILLTRDLLLMVFLSLAIIIVPHVRISLPVVTHSEKPGLG